MRFLICLSCAIFFQFSNVHATGTLYVNALQLDLIPFIPPPAANGSIEDKKQQLQVLAIQNAASKARIEQANTDAAETIFVMFSSVMGTNFTQDALPKITALFRKIDEVEHKVVDPVKAHFARTRPYSSNPQIKPLVRPSTSGSYPSGHATRSTITAILLSKMSPEKQAAIFIRADAYAMSRVIGGMHYLEDLEAGRIAGSAIASALLADNQFMIDFNEAKTELRSALGL